MKLFINIGSGNDFQLKRFYQVISEKITIVDDPKKADILLVTSWSHEYTNNYKAVFVPYTGLNRFPVDDLEEKGTRVINTHAKAKLVAERAFTLCLTVLGKVVPYDHSLRREGKWSTRDNWGSEFWRSLHNLSVGIIGMGHIGQSLLNYLKPFNCKIVNLKRDQEKNLADLYVEDVNALIESSDIIFLACALNDQTKGIINLSHLDQLGNKVIINVARGPVLDEETLFLALKNNILYGAGIDVWYQYPSPNPIHPSQYDLSQFSQLVMSPHASCHADNFKNDYYDDIFRKINDFVEE